MNQPASSTIPLFPPDNENERLEALYRYDILDTQPEESFDRITRLASRMLRMPMAMVSLIDGDRQWFKSRHGLTLEETPRNVSFCTHTVMKDEPFIVEDTHAHRWFASGPMVAGELNVRSYVGVPLRTPSGHNIGALCVMDTRPHEVSQEELDALQDLARLAVDELELRHLASIDSLTGAMTRRAFLTAASAEVKRARRHKRPLACIIFDVDHLKAMNAAHGHAAGDQVLARVLAACRDELRASDHIGRLGGVEFAVLLPETGVEAAVVAEKLRHKISSLVVSYANWMLRVSASFGVTALCDTDGDIEDVTERATEAMRQAKSGGRNKVMLIEG